MTSPVNPYQPPRPEVPTAAAAQSSVRVCGTLTRQDVISAMRAVGKLQPWRLAMIVVPVALLLIGYLLVDPPPGGIRWPMVIGVAFCATLFADDRHQNLRLSLVAREGDAVLTLNQFLAALFELDFKATAVADGPLAARADLPLAASRYTSSSCSI